MGEQSVVEEKFQVTDLGIATAIISEMGDLDMDEVNKLRVQNFLLDAVELAKSHPKATQEELVAMANDLPSCGEMLYNLQLSPEVVPVLINKVKALLPEAN